MNPLRKKNGSLGKKLKGALTDLSVDIFGYEDGYKKHHQSNRGLFRAFANTAGATLYKDFSKRSYYKVISL